eukprot:12898774-Alexandrium_andersonii.AAC.1
MRRPAMRLVELRVQTASPPALAVGRPLSISCRRRTSPSAPSPGRADSVRARRTRTNQVSQAQRPDGEWTGRRGG